MYHIDLQKNGTVFKLFRMLTIWFPVSLAIKKLCLKKRLANSQPPACNLFFNKGPDHLGPSELGDLGRFMGTTWNRQLKFSAYTWLWFSEASQNLNSFRQLLFSLFNGGDQREKFKIPAKTFHCFLIFPFGTPIKQWG